MALNLTDYCCHKVREHLGGRDLKLNIVESNPLYLSLGDGSREYEIICGDNKDSIPNIPSRSVDLVITSPPYFSQREYTTTGLGNEGTIEEYLDNIIETFKRIVPVMKPTGNIVYNMGDKIIGGSLQLVPYRFAVRVISDLDLRLVNDITWIKLNPTPHQFPRRLVNSTEPFFHFALNNEYYYDRLSFQSENQTKRGKPTERLGNRYRSLIETSTLTEEERRMANEALNQAIADVRAGAIQSFRMKIRGIHAPAYGGQEGGRKMHLEKDGFTIIRISGEPMKRDIIESPVESIPGNGHPAIFPVNVVQEIIRLLCPPEGRVLDPYLGSGSTMVAAALEGRSCIGLDISQDYCNTAWERLMRVTQPLPMTTKTDFLWDSRNE